MEDSVLKNYQAELAAKRETLLSITQPYADNGMRNFKALTPCMTR